VRAEHDNARVGQATQDFTGGDDPVHPGQRDVHQHHVGLSRLDDEETVAGRTRLTNQAIGRHRFEKVAHAGPQHLVIVDDDNFQRLHAFYLRARRGLRSAVALSGG
jgi:hypothetical protein